MRGLRTIPVLLDVCRDMEELCPDALLLQLRQPDGDELLGGRPRPARSAPSGSATPCRARPASSPPTSACRPRRSTTTSPASTTWRSSCGSSATARTSTRRCASSTPPAANRVRYEVLRHFGYFVTESSEHFAEYVPWFIKAARPDLIERFNIPLDEYPRRCEAQIAEWEALRARARGRRRDRRPGAASSTAPTSSARARPASRSPSTATSPTAADGGLLIDNLPGRLLRRGAVRGLDAAGSSRSPSARCRPSSPR